MASPEDLNPPSYLRGSSHSNLSDPFTTSSPPPRRKSRFTSTTTSAPQTFTQKPHREPLFADSEVSSPPAGLMLPPPAVTKYAYARSYSAYSNQRSPLHSLRQQAKHLTEQLQVLLDAQSTALMSGGTFAPAEKAPKKRAGGKGPPPMSLGEARSGITRSMKELAEIKDVEEDIYASQVSDRESLVKTVGTWGKKTKLLETEIHSIEEGEEGQRMEALRTEKGELEAEIQKIRVHLAKMEDKLAAVSIQLTENESIVSSKTSSYKASLTALKNKTSSFLASHRYASPSTAVESWTLECEALNEKRAQARTEGEALRDGIVLWEDTLKLVGGFEEQLRSRMSIAGGKRVNTADIKARILQDIEETIGKLEEILGLAEDKNWKLLCCCVGAELQVFLEGREVMKKSMESDQAKRSTISSTKGTASSTETSKDSDDGGSQHDERSVTMTQSRGSLRSGIGGFGLGNGPSSNVRKSLGTPSSLRKSLSPAPKSLPVGLSLLDRRSDDGQSPHENDGDDERDGSVDLLLKVDNVGDGVHDRPDYSPLDD